MEEQQLDGIVLAAAGLKRLGMEDVITQISGARRHDLSTSTGCSGFGSKRRSERIAKIVGCNFVMKKQ